MLTVFRFRPEDFPFWSRRFPGGLPAALLSAAGVVEAVGFLLVGHDIGGGEAFVHHAVIQFKIEIAMLDKGCRQIIQVDLAENPDKQAQHADRARLLLIGKDLIDEHQVST